MFTRQIAQKILKWKIEASPVNAALSSISNKAIESVLLRTEWSRLSGPSSRAKRCSVLPT